MKAPATKRLKLKCDEQLSNFAFKLNMRPFSMVPPESGAARETGTVLTVHPLVGGGGGGADGGSEEDEREGGSARGGRPDGGVAAPAAVEWFALSGAVVHGREAGLHSSTFRLNVSAFCGVGVALRGCLGCLRGGWGN